MSGTILENLSNRKLFVLVSILSLWLFCCFVLGLIAPRPATSQGILATVCLDPNPNSHNVDHWVTPQTCRKVDLHDDKSTMGYQADQLVFVVEMPLYKLDFSRWQQNLIGVLQLDVLYEDYRQPNIAVELTINAKLAYSDKKGRGRAPWALYAHAEEKRYIDCIINPKKAFKRQPTSCSMVPLFELGCLYHDYYLLNLRLPYSVEENKNVDLQKVTDLYVHIIHMNGGFTRILLGLKTIFFPIVLATIFWFWRRVQKLNRSPALLECMLASLGGALAFIDLPIEYLTLFFRMPYMLLLNDIRQGIFYALLFSFWLVFAGEHMLISDHGERSSLKMYWKHLSTILIACVSLLIFDLCERGIQLINPFYSIWVTPLGTNLSLSFIILAGLSALCYLLFLTYMVRSVLKNINIKRSVLPNMSQARRLHYEGIIYRFNFLLFATMVCASTTIISFVLTQAAEGQVKWEEDMDLTLSSAMHIGVFGMWNVYICGMLMLYAPSHKQWPSEPMGEGDEVEFSRLPTDNAPPNEISSLTSFATKASIE